MHPDLEKAINENPVALKNFEKLILQENQS
jgi:hypothetical protein